MTCRTTITLLLITTLGPAPKWSDWLNSLLLTNHIWLLACRRPWGHSGLHSGGSRPHQQTPCVDAALTSRLIKSNELDVKRRKLRMKSSHVGVITAVNWHSDVIGSGWRLTGEHQPISCSAVNPEWCGSAPDPGLHDVLVLEHGNTTWREASAQCSHK